MPDDGSSVFGRDNSSRGYIKALIDPGLLYSFSLSRAEIGLRK